MKQSIKILITVLFVTGYPIIELTAQIVTSNTGNITVIPNTQMSVLGLLNNTANANFVNNGDLLLYGDITNDGDFLYNSNLSSFGQVQFLGSQNQVISGANSLIIQDVFFNNKGTSLLGSIFITGSSDFTNGIIENRAAGGSFIFDGGSIHLNTSNASHVDGLVTKIGDDEFIFPKGAGGFYRGLSISSPIDINHTFTSQYHRENSNSTYPHTSREKTINHIDTREYWELERDQGTGHVLITLSWNKDTTDPMILSSTEVLSIVYWNPSQANWETLPSVVNQSNQTVTTITTVSGYGIFALGVVDQNAGSGGIVVYNALSPNGDGKNDFLRIAGVETIPDNSLEIFNRWGIRVFETSNYNNTDNLFNGFSQGRITINKKKKLPSGTYFYILKYKYMGEDVKKVGYLYINGSD